MNKPFPHAPDLEQALSRAARLIEAPVLEVDVQRYQAYLDDPSLSDAEKEEIIRVVWAFMSAMVELGFGVSPVQQACGQLDETRESSGEDAWDMVDSEPTDVTKQFNETPERK